MTEIEELHAELAGLRMLFEVVLRREWHARNDDPQWPDGLRVDGIREIERHLKTDPLRREIRQSLVAITQRALT